MLAHINFIRVTSMVVAYDKLHKFECYQREMKFTEVVFSNTFFPVIREQ